MKADRNLHTVRNFALTTVAVAFILVGISARGLAQSEQILYDFPNDVSGANPEGGLVMDKTGDLYGTTVSAPTVFKLAPPAKEGEPWIETIIYDFSGLNAGSAAGGVVFDSTGKLYGVTAQGGEYGYGSVYQLAAPSSGEMWTETTLYSFTGNTDGQTPNGSLTIVGETLYGITAYGGTSGAGTIFRLTPPGKAGGSWAESILYSFTGGNDGARPGSSLAMGAGGVLYGTTMAGGVNANGVVYQLSPPTTGSSTWTETVLHSFPDGNDDGLEPTAGLILDKEGALYGMTEFSSGSLPYGLVFKLVPPLWSEAILYNFTDEGDGEHPTAGLIFDSSGNLYGTTAGSLMQGGNQGSVFKLAPPKSSGAPWTETTLHSFTGGDDGGTPEDSLLLKGGLLYGTTFEGGPFQPSCNCGLVFSIKP